MNSQSFQFYDIIHHTSVYFSHTVFDQAVKQKQSIFSFFYTNEHNTIPTVTFTYG